MKKVLIIVDMQNDFCNPKGSLAIKGALNLVPKINKSMREHDFDQVIATKDYHPEGHISFASSHPHKKVLESIDLGYTKQILWQDHCVKGTWGAQLVDGLEVSFIDKVLKKGQNLLKDSYSAFFENDKTTPTLLTEWLLPIENYKLFICGVAREFCVEYTYKDALRLGYDVEIIEELTCGLNN